MGLSNVGEPLTSAPVVDVKAAKRGRTSFVALPGLAAQELPWVP